MEEALEIVERRIERLAQRMDRYCIKDGYKPRLKNRYFDDTPLKDEWQKEVYEKARAIVKRIKADGPKGVQSQVQGDTVRVSSKKRDDLQAVIAMLREADFGIPLQFQNYR